VSEPDEKPAALKEIFNRARLAHIAQETQVVYPAFDQTAFVARASVGLDDLALMARLRRVSETLHEGLPASYARALPILRALAPRLNSRFVTLALADYVALYGLDDVEASLSALEFLTPFGSAEFAIRHFLRHDQTRTLARMQAWSLHENEHVRRLASEGSRPRLPWSFKLDALVRDPSLAAPILENLKADDSAYVRKSVANHLNDISKDNPDWAMARIESWPLAHPHTAWIARHALRSLIKQGDKRALAVIGAGDKARLRLGRLSVLPPRIRLGDAITVSFTLDSEAADSQRLVIDYAIHYVKRSGASSAKVFKLKTLTLAAGESLAISRRQQIRDFSTRTHHPGEHAVDILINGECLGRASFVLEN
jgi:3-methyladenine DNA glycosylase AlkC